MSVHAARHRAPARQPETFFDILRRIFGGEPARPARAERRSRRRELDAERNTDRRVANRARSVVAAPAERRRLPAPDAAVRANAPARAPETRSPRADQAARATPAQAPGFLSRFFGGNQALAENRLRAQLGTSRREVIPGRVYVVQLDTRSISPGSMSGRTYVFRGEQDGSLKMLDSFRSSSQPSALRHDESQFPATRNFGPAFIREGLYTLARKVDKSYKEWGGSFRIPGNVSAFRFGGLVDSRRNNVDADGILLHDERLGSAGCQRIENFAGMRDLIMRQGGHSTFDYVLARV